MNKREKKNEKFGVKEDKKKVDNINKEISKWKTKEKNKKNLVREKWGTRRKIKRKRRIKKINK